MEDKKLSNIVDIHINSNSIPQNSFSNSDLEDDLSNFINNNNSKVHFDTNIIHDDIPDFTSLREVIESSAQTSQTKPVQSTTPLPPTQQMQQMQQMQREVQPQMQREVQPQMQREVQPQMQREVQPQMQREVQPQMQREIQPQMQREVQPQMQMQREMQPQMQMQREMQPQMQREVLKEVQRGVPRCEQYDTQLSSHQMQNTGNMMESNIDKNQINKAKSILKQQNESNGRDPNWFQRLSNDRPIQNTQNNAKISQLDKNYLKIWKFEVSKQTIFLALSLGIIIVSYIAYHKFSKKITKTDDDEEENNENNNIQQQPNSLVMQQPASFIMQQHPTSVIIPPEIIKTC
jgi:hypothetical protein